MQVFISVSYIFILAAIGIPGFNSSAFLRGSGNCAVCTPDFTMGFLSIFSMLTKEFFSSSAEARGILVACCYKFNIK